VRNGTRLFVAEIVPLVVDAIAIQVILGNYLRGDGDVVLFHFVSGEVEDAGGARELHSDHLNGRMVFRAYHIVRSQRGFPGLGSSYRVFDTILPGTYASAYASDYYACLSRTVQPAPQHFCTHLQVKMDASR